MNAHDTQADEEKGARLHYESAALPTELRRPPIDSKWDAEKRKAEMLAYAARASAIASYSCSDSAGNKTHMV